MSSTSRNHVVLLGALPAALYGWIGSALANRLSFAAWAVAGVLWLAFVYPPRREDPTPGSVSAWGGLGLCWLALAWLTRRWSDVLDPAANALLGAPLATLWRSPTIPLSLAALSIGLATRIWLAGRSTNPRPVDREG